MWQRPESRASGNVVVKAFVALAALALALVVPFGPVRPAAAQATPGGGGEYTPVVPFRVVDTLPVHSPFRHALHGARCWCGRRPARCCCRDAEARG